MPRPKGSKNKDKSIAVNAPADIDATNITPVVVNKGGRPRLYNSPDDLQNKINDYFDDCKDNKMYPDEAGMLLFLGICRDTLENYLGNEKGNYDGYSTPIKNARLRRESMLVRDLYGCDSKEATSKIFLAKQISNGGLMDRPASSAADMTIKVDFGFNSSKAE